MKTLDGHGDDYRNAQLTILLEVSISGTTYLVWLLFYLLFYIASVLCKMRH